MQPRTPTPPLPSARRGRRACVLPLVIAAGVAMAVGTAPAPTADAATITAAYAVGHRQVTINDYGTQGLGVFVLRGDPGDPFDGQRLALCIEADSSHSTEPGRYRLVENRVVSPQLDYLLWKYGWPGTAEHVDLLGHGQDHDTATALGALAWYYADASRRQGGPVWANPAAGFAPISPIAPHRWDALPTYSSGFPVGLRSGGFHLDAAERRVLELHLEAEARQGPWVMSPATRDGDHVSVTVTGPAGPIGGADGVRFVVLDHRGALVSNTVTRTGSDGVASVAVGTMPNGGSVAVSMFAPGVHQEWDGDGDVQRMSTATNRRLDRSLTLTPSPRHVRVEKRSTDPLFGVEGARFALLDAGGRTISTATSDAAGRASFPPADPATHPLPYSVRETRAPDGLRPLDDEVAVPEPSTDPARPTTVVLDNEPVEHGLRIRKELSDPRVGPADRSGFEFEVTRVDDDIAFGAFTTDRDGRTERIPVTRGQYQVCERGRPEWAEVLHDPGCTVVEVRAGTPEVEVTYTNVVPAPSISTRVHVEGSGDDDGAPLLPSDGGVLIDTVTFDRVVPGTEYHLHGEIHEIGADEVTPTGITASTVIVPESASGTAEVHFEVPAGSGIDVGVVFQELRIDDEVVAEHADPEALEQTFWVPSITTEASLTEHGLVDSASFRGLPPGPAEAWVVWHVKHPDGTCHEGGPVATEPLAIEHHHGSVVVGPVEVGDDLLGATLVAFHHLLDGEGRSLVDHADCGAVEQTVVVPAPPASTTTAPPPASTTAPPTAPSTGPPPVQQAPPAPAATTSTSTTVPATTAPQVTAPPRTPLPRAGQGLQLPTALALLAAGSGGLAVVGAAFSRRRAR